MKKLFSAISAVIVLFVVLSLFPASTPKAAYVKTIWKDGFENVGKVQETETIDAAHGYYANSCKLEIVNTTNRDGLGCMKVTKNKWWGGPRVYITREKFSFDKTYVYSFYIKFETGAPKEKIGVQIMTDETHGTLGLFSHPTIGSDGWYFISGTFCMKDLFAASTAHIDLKDIPTTPKDINTNPRANEKVWQFCIVPGTEGNIATFYIENLLIVEGDALPDGRNANQNWAYYDDYGIDPPTSGIQFTEYVPPVPSSTAPTPSTPATTSSTVKPSSTTSTGGGNTTSGGGNTNQSGTSSKAPVVSQSVSKVESQVVNSDGTVSTVEVETIVDVIVSDPETNLEEPSLLTSGTNKLTSKTGNSDDSSDFPLIPVIVIGAVIVLALGGVLLYFLKIKKKA